MIISPAIRYLQDEHLQIQNDINEIGKLQTNLEALLKQKKDRLTLIEKRIKCNNPDPPAPFFFSEIYNVKPLICTCFTIIQF